MSSAALVESAIEVEVALSFIVCQPPKLTPPPSPTIFYPVRHRERYRSVFLRSPEWAVLRQSRLQIDDFTCLGCGVRSDHNDVHHIYYPKDWNRAETRDLRTLCRDCHNLIEAFSIPWSVGNRAEGERRFRNTLRCLDAIRRLRSDVLAGVDNR